MRISAPILFFAAVSAVACGGGDDAPGGESATSSGGQGGASAGASGKGGASAGAPSAGGQAGSPQAGAGGKPTAGSAGVSGSGGGAGLGGSAGSGGVAGGAGVAGSAGQGGAPAPTSGGLIVMASIPPNAALPDGRGLVTASFFEDQPDTCQRETVGACTLSMCPTPPSGPSAVPPPDAGDIDVKTGVKAATLSPGTGVDPNTYFPFTSQSVLYYGGETITVDAAGGGVPKFATSVTAPDAVSFTKPYTKVGDTLTLDSTKDYLCEWSQTLDDVRFGVTMKDASSGSSMDVELSCTFDGSKSQGTVPQALLAKLPKKLGSLSVSARNQVVVTAGKFSVTVRALAPAYGPTGASITSDVVVK